MSSTCLTWLRILYSHTIIHKLNTIYILYHNNRYKYPSTQCLTFILRSNIYALLQHNNIATYADTLTDVTLNERYADHAPHGLSCSYVARLASLLVLLSYYYLLLEIVNCNDDKM